MSVTVYIRPRCPLCEQVREALAAGGISVTAVDITQDSALAGRYRYAVPVVEVDGIERLRAPFTESELEAVVVAARGSDEGA